MCGLAAVLNRFHGDMTRDRADNLVRRAIAYMSYRGIPGRASFVEIGAATLGHVRLPIINQSPEKDQPFLSRGGTTYVIYNGEIFNYQEIDPQAECDTEVILDTFVKKGVNAFHQFDGFWSAVFADEIGCTVVTDYLSQKPLYYHAPTTMVASEPAAIQYAINESLTLDPVYFSNVLKWGYDPTGRTPFKDICQLPAGSYMNFSGDGQGKVTSYWDWRQVPQPRSLFEEVRTATKNRLVGDRPVSLLLSGGLDSTILFRLLTRELNNPVTVFHAENAEEEFVQMALEGFPSKVLRTEKVPLEDAVLAHQVPVDLGSVVPQLALSNAVNREGFNVCMSGDGADELFGGYRRAKEYDSQASDVFMELPYYHLPRLDRLNMINTIELRTPFLAPKVIKLALSLPYSLRQEKYALKESFSNMVPMRILNRAKHPLKTSQVIEGGIEYRKALATIWRSQFNDQ